MIDFFFNANTEGENSGLAKLVVTDNGIGFDDANFERLKVFKDDTKGFNNRGSGRLQLLHSFSHVKYESTYLNNQGGTSLRQFTLSKGDTFLAHNSILQLEKEEPTESTEIKTRLSMYLLRASSDIKFYNERTIDDIKKASPSSRTVTLYS